VSTVRAFLLDGFGDSALDAARWDALLHRGDTDVVYLTREWQSAWWDVLGRGRLMLIAVERDGQIVALAPMYAEEGMLFFVGSGDADYMDFIGDIEGPGVLDAVLDAAACAVPDFCGFRLYAIPGGSCTGARLQASALRLGWACYREGRWAAPRIDLIAGRSHAQAVADGRRVSKRERYLSRRGSLELKEFDNPDEIRQRLDTFFDQHVERWRCADGESPFAAPAHRRFLDEATARTGAAGWPRLTWLEWQGRPIACEFGWVYRGAYLAEAACFDVALAERSPGQVLQRQLVLAVLRDGLAAYDFGTGDDPYKLHYATEVNHVETWGLFSGTADEAVDVVETAS
jgi:CelD/BcsL family acetyltransferase involved in cellulose biosynthesis